MNLDRLTNHNGGEHSIAVATPAKLRLEGKNIAIAILGQLESVGMIKVPLALTARRKFTPLTEEELNSDKPLAELLAITSQTLDPEEHASRWYEPNMNKPLNQGFMTHMEVCSLDEMSEKGRAFELGFVPHVLGVALKDSDYPEDELKSHKGVSITPGIRIDFVPVK